jgi:predicted dehydrogenase
VNTLTLGIYYEAVQRWLREDATVTAAEAEIVTARRRDATGAWVEVDVPDRVSVDGGFPGGARLRCDISAVETVRPRNEITLRGECGELRLDLAAERLQLRETGGDWRQVEPDPGLRGSWRVEADFVDSIRLGTPVRLTDFATGVRYMRFTEAAWRAWQR